MIKRILLLTSFILLMTLSCFAIGLNQFGHITNIIKQKDIKYSIENEIYVIRYKGHVFEGNSFLRTASGYLTLITIEDNVPSILHLYDNNGELIYKNTYDKIINISLSDNGEFIAFFNGKGIVVLRADAIEIKLYPGSIIFAVDDLGYPVYYNAEQKIINYKSNSTYLN